MKLSFGNLTFEDGDVIHIEDRFGKDTCVAKQGLDCGKCVFGSICNARNPNNTFAKYCKETHFEEEKSGQ